MKWFLKSNITENPQCTRHGSLDSGSWSLAQMRLRLPTAPPAHSHRLHDLLQNTGRSGTRQQFSPTLTAEVLQFRINSCTATCQTQEKECSPSPKMAENGCNNVKTLHSPASGNRDSYLCRLGDNVFNLSLHILLKPWSSNYPSWCG